MVKSRFLSILLVVTTPLVLASGLLSKESAEISQWSTPKRIPDYNDPLHSPYLVADQNQTVHAFDLETTGAQQYAIIYRRWTLTQGWSAPVDVLLPEFLGLAPALHGVYLDENGIFHLVFFGGDLRSGNIFYTSAYAAEADHSQAWATPVPVGPDAGPVAAATVIGNGQGDLIVAYGGQRDGVGVYEVHSTDGGVTWSGPTPVSVVDQPGIWPTSVRLEVDGRGRVHAVWHISNSFGQGEAIYYARLNAELTEWDDQTVLASRDYEQENMGWGSMISVGEDDLIVIYQDSFPATKWMRRSSDGGHTWTKPVRPFPHVGGYEYVALMKDANNLVHMVLGNRFPDPEIHGMWYSRFVDNVWTPLEPIISGPATSSFDPCCPRAVIVQGNMLLATWPHNVRQEFLTGAWYSYTSLDAPELPVVPLPTSPISTTLLTVLPTATGTSAEPVVTTQPTANELSEAQANARDTASPAIPIFFGVAPAVIFILVLVIRQYTRGKSR